ncbi:hypothetical protein QVD17_01442 [Tagetes erecta]|uniref:Uncharacterized protein n=1 Tax=Tagetes erecta TaxID=13708 RepID=A0AAD8P8C3_TARER|nr:hypothetical protein QVD17_01442 [Tagetes erecta]
MYGLLTLTIPKLCNSSTVIEIYWIASKQATTTRKSMGIWNDLKSVAGRFINRSDSTTVSPKPPVELPDPVRRETITRVLAGFGKFAVDSAVYDPIKGGMQVYRVVKEGMKDQSALEPANLNYKPRHTLMMEEMQARMEKLQEDLHIIRLDDEDSILCAKDLDPRKEEPDESNENSAPAKADAKKVFIRSRL